MKSSRICFLGWISISAFFLFSFIEPRADVSFERGNGNVFFTFKDTVQPEVSRIYNSKSAYKGMFGWGWGNGFDTYLEISPDGSLVVHEYGGGADNRFYPISGKQGGAAGGVEEGVNQIAAVAQRSGMLATPAQIEAYKQKLRSNPDFRGEEWARFISQRKVAPKTIGDGTEFLSTRFSYQRVKKVPGGYVRTSDTGKIEKFDSAGRLVRIADRNNNHVDLFYTRDGVLQRLADTFNRKLKFDFNKKRLVERITTEGGLSAQYRYNDDDELVYSQDIAKNVYKYTYDRDRRHNLTSIIYPDATTLEFGYWGKDKHENVRFEKRRDKTLTEYNYSFDSKVKGHSTVEVSLKDSKGGIFAKTTYDYYAKSKPTGEEWTQRLVLNDRSPSDRMETVYDENCGLPLLLKRGSWETRFQIDQKCRVIKKETPDQTTDLSFDPVVGKVSKVVITPKGGVGKVIWSEFKYDSKGNLILGRNAENKEVRLVYDTMSRISAIIEKSGHQMRFKYNEESKPVEITDPAVGTIRVSYTNNGEIKSVDSPSGRKVANTVSRTFQDLLEIIKPAGVTFSF